MQLTQAHLDRYRSCLVREEKSPATLEKYLRDVGAFYAFAEGREITKDLTVAYKKYLAEKGYALRSVNSMLASLNSLLTFLGLAECRVKSLKCQRQTYCAEEKELTRAEYLRLLEASRSRPRLNLVLQTICATGIRVSELRYFTVEGVRRGEVTVRCKNKTRTVLVPGKLKNLLLSFARKQGIAGGVIFVTGGGKPLDRSNIWAQMKGLCRKAGVKACRRGEEDYFGKFLAACEAEETGPL